MTISSQSSFNKKQMIAMDNENIRHFSSDSLDSMCSFNTNTTTTFDSEDFSMPPFPTLPSEDEDWLEFGYLLDSEDANDVLPSPAINKRNRTGGSLHTSSQRSSSERSLAETEFSSLDVEASTSSASTIPQFSFGNKDDTGKGNMPMDFSHYSHEEENTLKHEEEDEPVSKRTRSSKDDSFSLINFISTTHALPTKKSHPQNSSIRSKTRIHNGIRPWWHAKFLDFHNSLESTKKEEQGSDESENDVQEGPKKVVENDEEPIGLCDPRFITLGSNTTTVDNEVMLKMEIGSSTGDVKVNTNRDMQDDRNGDGVDEEKSTIKDEERNMSPTRHSQRLLQLHHQSPPQEPMKSRPATTIGMLAEKECQRECNSKLGKSLKRPATKRAHMKSDESDGMDETSKESKSKKSHLDKHCSYCGGSHDSHKFRIICCQCRRWYHGKCAGIGEKKARKCKESWICPECKKEESTSSLNLFCLCRRPYDNKFYVACDSCNEWYHPECVGTTEQKVNKLDEFICPKCLDPPSHTKPNVGKKTVKRNFDYDSSSSASTANPNQQQLSQADYPLLWKLLESLSDSETSKPFSGPEKSRSHQELIKQPMNLAIIRKKLEDREYIRLKDFVSDVCLIFENARTLHNKDTKAWQCAEQLEKIFRENLLSIREEIDQRNQQRVSESAANESFEESSDNLAGFGSD